MTKRKRRQYLPEESLQCLLEDLIDGKDVKDLAHKYNLTPCAVNWNKRKYLEVVLRRKPIQLKLL
jgi:hypothetical protein